MQARILDASPLLRGDVKTLLTAIRKVLLEACDDGMLANAPHSIFKHVDCVSRRDRATGAALEAIVGGPNEHNCTPADGAFKRDDGAWFTFMFQVSDVGGSLRLESYALRLCFPRGSTPAFLRFDLDGPGKANPAAHEREGLRSHLHPGHDDLRVPAPILHPLELLDLVIYGLRP